MTIEATVIDATERGLEYIHRAKSISPIIMAEAATMEQQRRVTQPVVDALKEAELFWMLVPSELGGGGIGVRHATEVIEEISRADGSTGWAFMANAASNANTCGYFPPEGATELFGGKEKAILCGFSAPMGTAVEVEGGIIAKAARLSYGSGSDYATHIGSGVRIVNEDGSDKLEDGQVAARWVFAPRENIKFHGNWDVMGMVGTGSQDFELPEQFIPNKFLMSTFSNSPYRDEGVYGFGLMSLSVAGHAGVALGLMKRALQEIATIAITKNKQGTSEKIAENQLFRHDFAVHEAQYQAVRAHILNAFSDSEEVVVREGELNAYHHARIQQVSTWVHNVADEVIGFCQLWGGSKAFRNPSALGRATRDIAVAKGHLLVDQQTLVGAASPIIELWANTQGDAS